MASFVPQFPFAKGPLFLALDLLSVAPDARMRLEALARALRNIASNDFQELEKVTEQFVVAPFNQEQFRSAAYIAHMWDHWFNPDSATTFFPGHQPIAPAFAGGMLIAVEKSLDGNPGPKPIDAWWIMNHEKFEVMTLVSERQVTMLMCTPRPHGVPPKGLWHPEAEGYVTGHHGVVTRKYIPPR